MKRSSLNFVVDLTSLVFFLCMALTGIVLEWILPPGSGKRHLLWGLSRHEWGNIHSNVSLVLLGGLVIHIALHWKWIVATVSTRAAREEREVLTWGLVSLLVVLAVFAAFTWIATASVVEVETMR